MKITNLQTVKQKKSKERFLQQMNIQKDNVVIRQGDVLFKKLNLPRELQTVNTILFKPIPNQPNQQPNHQSLQLSTLSKSRSITQPMTLKSITPSIKKKSLRNIKRLEKLYHNYIHESKKNADMAQQFKKMIQTIKKTRHVKLKKQNQSACPSYIA